MSWARMGWDGSDVYIFEHVAGHIECCMCRFDDPWIVQLRGPDEVMAHLAKHEAAEHVVPQSVYDNLAAWMAERQ